MKWQAVSTVLRDLVCMSLGTFIMLHEELSGQVHPALLTAAAPLLAGPTAIALWHTARRGGKPSTRRTRSQSSGSRSE